MDRVLFWASVVFWVSIALDALALLARMLIGYAAAEAAAQSRTIESAPARKPPR